jgi:hypothetical protein
MPLPESLQKLLNNPNIQKMQLMMNYPSVRRMQQIFDNYPKINEFRVKVYYSNLNIQMPIQIMDSQLQIIKNYSEVYSNWNNIINSAIDACNSTQEEKVKIVIENFPVIIVKTNLQEYFEKFRSLKIPDSIAVKLSFITYFILEFAPVIYVIPALIPFMQFLLKLFIIYGKPYIKALSKFQDPDVFSEKLADNTFSALFGSVITILGTLFMTKKK